MNWTSSETRADEIIIRAKKDNRLKAIRRDITTELELVQADMQQRCARIAIDAGQDKIANEILRLKVK